MKTIKLYKIEENKECIGSFQIIGGGEDDGINYISLVPPKLTDDEIKQGLGIFWQAGKENPKFGKWIKKASIYRNDLLEHELKDKQDARRVERNNLLAKYDILTAEHQRNTRLNLENQYSIEQLDSWAVYLLNFTEQDGWQDLELFSLEKFLDAENEKANLN